MRNLSIGAFLAAGLLSVGCSRDEGMKGLGPVRGTIAASMEAMGGLAAWDKVTTIKATAVLSLYDDKGEANVTRQTQTIDLTKNTLTAEGRAPQGTWRAEVDEKGAFTFQSSGYLETDQAKTRLAAGLAMLLHRVRGPLNLVQGEEQATQSRSAKVDGSVALRVGVKGGFHLAQAYYFDTGNNLLRFLTTGGDAAGAQGTITIYHYKVLPNGMAFPDEIRIMKIGQHSLIGETPILKVEYSDVQINK